MKPLVSVIVPVYKVEKWLCRCLDSLKLQSLANIEIILVDDASPDRCGEICEEYVAKDSRFTVVHNEVNRGLSVARNIGINKAVGCYLMFVDSDDWVHKDFCKDAYACAEYYQADLVMFRRQWMDIGGHSIRTPYPKEARSSGYKTREEAMNLLQHAVGEVIWNKLYRKEMFQTVSFPEGYLQEDIGTTYKLIWQATRIYYLDKILYYHCLRDGSITSQKTEKYLQDGIAMRLKQYRDLAAWGYYSPEKQKTVLFNLALEYCMQKRPDSTDLYYSYCADVVRHCQCNFAAYTWKQNVMLFLFRHFPFLFEWVCILYGKKVC